MWQLVDAAAIMHGLRTEHLPRRGEAHPVGLLDVEREGRGPPALQLEGQRAVPGADIERLAAAQIRRHAQRVERRPGRHVARARGRQAAAQLEPVIPASGGYDKIGRASCRERVCSTV